MKPKLTLINKKSGLKVLHPWNTKFIVQKLHRDNEHIKAVKIEWLAKHCYKIHGAWFIVREVILNCDYCNHQIINRQFTGPLVHATRLTPDRICDELGLVINDRPILENNCCKNAPHGIIQPLSLKPWTLMLQILIAFALHLAKY